MIQIDPQIQEALVSKFNDLLKSQEKDFARLQKEQEELTNLHPIQAKSLNALHVGINEVSS